MLPSSSISGNTCLQIRKNVVSMIMFTSMTNFSNHLADFCSRWQWLTMNSYVALARISLAILIDKIVGTC